MWGRNNQVVGVFKQRVKVSFNPLKFSVLDDFKPRGVWSWAGTQFSLSLFISFLSPFASPHLPFPLFFFAGFLKIDCYCYLFICLLSSRRTSNSVSPNLAHLSFQRKEFRFVLIHLFLCELYMCACFVCVACASMSLWRPAVHITCLPSQLCTLLFTAGYVMDWHGAPAGCIISSQHPPGSATVSCIYRQLANRGFF